MMDESIGRERKTLVVLQAELENRLASIRARIKEINKKLYK